MSEIETKIKLQLKSCYTRRQNLMLDLQQLGTFGIAGMITRLEVKIELLNMLLKK